MSGTCSYWFIRDDKKLRQVTKEAFDRAIIEGKSVKYQYYQNKKAERIAEELESSRMEFLAKLDLSPKFRAVLTNPSNVVEVQIIQVDDPQFWRKESKKPKYQF
jgi:hypothetical protein